MSMASHVVTLVGRDEEMRVLAAVVERVGVRGGAVVVRGEAGIGKSALLAQASRVAAAGGCGCCFARPGRIRAVTRFSINAAAGSEIGHRYVKNFDVVHLSVDPLLAVVADGMGDGPGSEMAGRTTVETVVERFQENGGIAEIRDAISTAQRRVSDYGREIGGLAGCTLTTLVQTTDGFWIAQLGDSRVYRLRAGLLELLTVDHTMAWLGAVHGWYPFDSAQAASARYQLTRYVGHFGLPDPDLMKVEPRPGDVFLLCSDGVAEQVSYHEIRNVLGQPGSSEDKVRKLLAAADAAGGNDNATAVVVTVAV